MKRFWSKVDIRQDDECWPWTGSKFSNGYGRYFAQGKSFGAHRISLSLKLGREIASNMCAMHTCDNKICVNPSHLEEGTVADNVADMDAKGRRADKRGSLNGMSSLSERDVQKIRSMFSDGYTQQAIANHIGISQPTVSNIITRKTWGHIA